VEELFLNFVRVKKLAYIFFTFLLTINAFAETYRTVNDGFWTDANVWLDNQIPNNANWGDTIIIDNRIEVDQNLNFYDIVFIVTNNGVLCSNYYSLNFNGYSTIFNNGYIAMRYIQVGPGSVFHNNGTVRTEQITESHSKKEPDGEYIDNGSTIIEQLENACPKINEPNEPDSTDQVVNESIQIKEDTIELCEGKSPEFSYSKARYVWSNGAVNSDFIPEESGLYTVEIISKINSASNTDTVYIIVIPGLLSIPNIFTPNDDEINDNFLKSDFNLNQLHIYNRWGKQVLSSGGAENNYNELSDGSYYYVIEHENRCIEKNPIKGWIQIER